MSSQAKRIATDVLGWMWGTVQGSFNDKMDTSQIITDAVIGMIPLVGDVTAARDLIAVSIGLAEDEKKREDTLQWVMLVIFIFALIPVIGGVVKGVGRLALRVTGDLAKDTKLLEEVIAFLNRIGHGNAVKWLQELNVLKYQAQVMERFDALMDTLIGVLGRVKMRLASVFLKSFVDRMDKWVEAFKVLKEAGDKMIPKAIKELHAKLLRLQQLVYRGEWHSVTTGTQNVTREVEGHMVEDSVQTARTTAHGGGKQNRAKAGPKATVDDKAAIEKVYKWQEGYPELTRKVLPTAFEKEVYVDIAAFSGTINAGKVDGGEYLLRIHTADVDTLNGAWWLRLPKGVTEANWRTVLKNGKEWRELLSVLKEYSENGAFSICRVKPDKTIKAWEGKASEQFGRINPGQYLPGGKVQLYLASWSQEFQEAVEWTVKFGKTEWTDLENVGYASRKVLVAGAARVVRLAQDEDQTKRPAVAGAQR
ncbi:MAG: hypothetical protein H6R19_2945 [Proteobacteria bacterium]|nr:hypothetical protein [Pseudomonadota bacterium]